MKTEKNFPESLLMAYLYGEASEAERQQVEQYLAENPKARAELLALKEVRRKLAALPDKEVIIPALPVTAHPRESDTRLFKTLLAVAASVAIILISLWLTNTHISWSDKEIRISFGNQPDSHTGTALTHEEVQAMIEQALRSKSLNETSATLTEQQVREWIRASVAPVAQPANTISDEQLKQYTSALYAENARLLREFINLSAREQQQAIEEMLIDFNAYLNQQRQNDLQNLYSRLNALEQNTELYKQETDQLLTGIMASVSTPVREIKN